MSEDRPSPWVRIVGAIWFAIVMSFVVGTLWQWSTAYNSPYWAGVAVGILAFAMAPGR